MRARPSSSSILMLSKSALRDCATPFTLSNCTLAARCFSCSSVYFLATSVRRVTSVCISAKLAASTCSCSHFCCAAASSDCMRSKAAAEALVAVDESSAGAPDPVCDRAWACCSSATCCCNSMAALLRSVAKTLSLSNSVRAAEWRSLSCAYLASAACLPATASCSCASASTRPACASRSCADSAVMVALSSAACCSCSSCKL
mmetsp:Transcript_17934/g.50110  ORF Transcript_17934/g.50110 Transcript_17934/m.50110 type:complete len:203 (-) Transcript_17934:176-784(-)